MLPIDGLGTAVAAHYGQWVNVPICIGHPPPFRCLVLRIHVGSLDTTERASVETLSVYADLLTTSSLLCFLGV